MAAAKRCYYDSEMRIAFLLVIAGCLLAPSQGASDTASLSGKVIDITGAGLPGVLAELQWDSDRKQVFYARADSAGVFQFLRLPAGEYSLKLSEPGFNWLTVRVIHVLDGGQVQMSTLQLDIPTGGCYPHAALDSIRFLPSEATTGDLTGVVVAGDGAGDGKGPPVPGADITLICADGPCPKTKTDSAGRFLFGSVAPGNYRVRVQKAGFYDLVEPDFKVKQGIESVYGPVFLESCYHGDCDPDLRPEKPIGLCE